MRGEEQTLSQLAAEMYPKLIAKKQRRRRVQDRISQLPDPILHHIFSFLSTENVVRLSVLSKRWRNLWVSMQCLIFHQSEFRRIENFVRFSDSVLLLRNPLNVDTFHLNWFDDYDDNRANLWSAYAINHNVRVLDLNVDNSGMFVEMPNCLFNCQSLEALHVLFHRRALIRGFSFVHLSRLRRLHFENVIFLNNILQKLISGCPVLEELHLQNCRIEKTDTPFLDISSQTMKNLTMVRCGTENEIRFSIPCLISLHYEDSHITRASFVNLSSLAYAVITNRSRIVPKQKRSVVKLIRSLSNAKNLTLIGPWIKRVFGKELSEFPTFPNLERLMVCGCCMSYNFLAAASFLERSPNLEYLTLKELIGRKSCACGLKNAWKPVNLSFYCPHLKMIEIRCSKTKEVVLDLANCEALPRIIINHE